MNTKEKNVKGILLLLVIAVLIMSVGFALYSQSLTINGTVTVKATKWDIHYDSTTYTETSGSQAAATHTFSSGDTDFAFTVTLNKPGDFYEASFDAKNYGTFNANMGAITMSTLTAAQAKYLTYTITYDGTTYSANQSGITSALAAGANKVVKVRVEYIQPASAADLPSADVNVTVTGRLDYTQS